MQRMQQRLLEGAPEVLSLFAARPVREPDPSVWRRSGLGGGVGGPK